MSHRSVAAASCLAVAGAVALLSPSSASAAPSLAAHSHHTAHVAAVTTSSPGSGSAKVVKMRDDCDVPTFEAALGAGACTVDGETSFSDLVSSLLTTGAHPKWRNSSTTMTIDHGTALTARNIGGEVHSFSEVASFGGGCVPDINQLVGLSPVPECGDPAVFPATVVPQGASLTVGRLHPGKHRFECLIHPWMRTTVTVKAG